VQEFLGLTDVEAAIVEMRVRLAEMVLEARRVRKVTQRELATRMGSAQPRVARLEQGDASIEMMLRALVAMGVDRKKIGRLLAA
jgi:transcriptional regulator with XRE-family HTH domain